VGVPIKRALTVELCALAVLHLALRGAADGRGLIARSFNLMHTWPPPIKSGRLGIRLSVAIEKVCAHKRSKLL
jgi:hypothetical protein